MKKNLKIVFIICLVLGIAVGALNLIAGAQKGHLAEIEEQQAARKKALAQIEAADILGIDPDSVVVPNDLTVNNHLIFPAGTKLAVACVSRRAFANCRHLTDIVMPQTLVYINDQAFLNCESLKSIVLPARLKRIYPFAFRGCQRLNTIQLHGLQPPDAFNDIFDSATLEQATLIIPGAAAEAYRKDYLWNLFRYRFDDIY